MKDLDEIYADALNCDPASYQAGNAKFERFVQAATPVAVGAMIEEMRSLREKVAAQQRLAVDLRAKLSDTQRALDGEISLSEFRRNQLVQLQSNDASENPQPFKWVLFWVSEFGTPVFNWAIYEEKEHAI
jgi:hypothetical protein